MPAMSVSLSGLFWHLILNHPATPWVVGAWVGAAKQELPAKPFGGQLFAGTRHPAIACVDEKSWPPSNVRARLLPACYTACAQGSRHLMRVYAMRKPCRSALRCEPLPGRAPI